MAERDAHLASATINNMPTASEGTDESADGLVIIRGYSRTNHGSNNRPKADGRFHQERSNKQQ